MSPELVVIKDFEGVALLRWMIGTVGTVAEITNEDGRRAIQAGRRPAFVVGFPLTDVYSVRSDIRINEGDRPNWAIFTRRF